MLKLATFTTELQFIVRRERDGSFLAVGADAGIEPMVVNAPTLKDLHINLADRVTVTYGRNVHIRLLVGRHLLAGPRVGPAPVRASRPAASA
jgi:hypothetical protein